MVAGTTSPWRAGRYRATLSTSFRAESYTMAHSCLTRICITWFRRDFFGTEEISSLENALCGILYQEDEIKKALEKVDLPVYIYGMERDALVNVLVG